MDISPGPTRWWERVVPGDGLRDRLREGEGSHGPPRSPTTAVEGPAEETLVRVRGPEAPVVQDGQDVATVGRPVGAEE